MGGKLYVLRPTSGKYEQFNASCVGQAPFRLDPGRSMAVIAIFRSITCAFGSLPDAHFGTNIGDVPGSGEHTIPVLSHHGYGLADLALPVPPAHEIMASVDTKHSPAWPEKEGRLIYADGHPWRTSIRNDPFPFGRFAIRELARNHSDLIYMPARPVPFKYWARHKYTLILDGVGPSGRLHKLLALNSTLFIPDAAPSAVNWAMPALVAWEHYIPVSRNLDNLLTRIMWAKKHDVRARQIAANAAAIFAPGGGLDQRGRFCAWYEAIRAVALAQVGVTLRDNQGPICPMTHGPGRDDCDYPELNGTVLL